MSKTPGRLSDGERASALLARLSEAAPDLLDAALFAADGEQIAATDGADWSPGARCLWAAADSRGRAAQVHVGTEEGEVFAVRGSSVSIVATSARFTLASLMLFDLRRGVSEFEAEVGN